MTAPGSLLAGIMNPAQANVLGALDKGRERQATAMAGDILGKELGGQLGELANLSPEKAIEVAKLTNTPITDAGRVKALLGTTIMTSQLWDAGLQGEAISTLEKQIQLTEKNTGEPATKLRMGLDSLRQGMQSGTLDETGEGFLQVGRNINPLNKPKTYEQASAKGMEGWNFDKSTGQYSLSPQYQQFLATDAGKLANKDFLTAKEVSGVNDKVTGLIKDSVGIYGAANDLIALESSGSTSDQIAAVFKFMKAMDPSSTVRESELGMVYNAEGAAQGFANYVNSLVQGKKIDPEGFKKIVRTAKTLSNSSSKAASEGVSSYVDVIADNISPKQYKLMTDRVPGQLEIPITVDY